MMEIPENIEELITRVLAETASADEVQELKLWRDLNSENEKYFQDMEFLFFASGSVKHSIPVDIDSAWNNIKSKTIVPKRAFLYRNSFKVAAALVLLALSSIGVYLFLQEDQSPKGFILYAENESQTTILPDSTEIILTKGSIIKALNSTSEYAYSLEGEASFSIHKSDKPFVLYAKDLTIRDIGTKFKISAYPLKDTTWIQVSDGMVMLETPEGGRLDITANESAFYLNSTKTLQKIQKESKNIKASFNFNAIRLGVAVELLSEHFETEIILANPQLSDCLISVNFESEKLENILDIICLTLNLELEKKNTNYLILGTACTPEP